jgi:predicted Zn-dependent protease
VTPGSAEENAFFAAARSFQALTEAGRLAPTPARIRIVAAPRAGTFGQVIGGLGAQAVDLEESAVLNGLETGDAVAQGHLLKLVTPARLH